MNETVPILFLGQLISPVLVEKFIIFELLRYWIRKLKNHINDSLKNLINAQKKINPDISDASIRISNHSKPKTFRLVCLQTEVEQAM